MTHQTPDPTTPTLHNVVYGALSSALVDFRISLHPDVRDVIRNEIVTAVEALDIQADAEKVTVPRASLAALLAVYDRWCVVAEPGTDMHAKMETVCRTADWHAAVLRSAGVAS
jgi:hypothetical protein